MSESPENNEIWAELLVLFPSRNSASPIDEENDIDTQRSKNRKFVLASKRISRRKIIKEKKNKKGKGGKKERQRRDKKRKTQGRKCKNRAEKMDPNHGHLTRSLCPYNIHQAFAMNSHLGSKIITSKLSDIICNDS